MALAEVFLWPEGKCLGPRLEGDVGVAFCSNFISLALRTHPVFCGVKVSHRRISDVTALELSWKQGNKR